MVATFGRLSYLVCLISEMALANLEHHGGHFPYSVTNPKPNLVLYVTHLG